MRIDRQPTELEDSHKTRIKFKTQPLRLSACLSKFKDSQTTDRELDVWNLWIALGLPARVHG